MPLLSLLLFISEIGSIVVGEKMVLESDKLGFNLSSVCSFVALDELLTLWSLSLPIYKMRMIIEPTF